MDRFKRLKMICELLADEVPARVDAMGRSEPVGFCLVVFYGDGTYAGATKAIPELLGTVLRKYLASIEADLAAAKAATDKETN